MVRRRKSGLNFGRRKKKINFAVVKEVLSWTVEIALTLLIAFTFVYFIGLRTSVVGQSMSKTLNGGDQILVNRFVYKVTDPKTNDIVVFLPNGNEKSHYYVKRVIGVPGDTVQIKNGTVYVNGKAFDEETDVASIEDAGLAAEEITLGADEYFVLGDNGAGKMPEAETLYEYIYRDTAYEKDLTGKKILVTAGPTREAIDPVRYITNHSSGKMGYALARVAVARGADVTLVTGPTEIKKPMFVKIVPVTTAKEMFEAVKEEAADADIVCKAAAVADYRPKHIADEKVKKSDSEMSLELEKTDDILKYLGEHRKDGQFLCGFSMETENMVENSRKKLEKKKLDMIAANNLKVAGAGFQGDTNQMTLITKEDETALPMISKEETAACILDKILECMNK